MDTDNFSKLSFPVSIALPSSNISAASQTIPFLSFTLASLSYFCPQVLRSLILCFIFLSSGFLLSFLDYLIHIAASVSIPLVMVYKVASSRDLSPEFQEHNRNSSNLLLCVPDWKIFTPA